MSPRTLRVVHVITGLNGGGAEAALFRLCTHDKMHRHHVVSLMDEGKYASALRDADVAVDCLGMAQGRVSFSGLVQLWRLVRRLRPDVIQTWMYHADLIGGVVARLAGVRTVIWGVRHSNLTPGTVKRSTIYVARICALLSHVVPTQIVSCSEQAVGVHAAMGYSKQRFVAIPNGYDLSQFRPDSAATRQLRASWGVPADLPLVGMVARFDPQKDHRNLLTALALLKREGEQFACVLVGTGMDDSNVDLSRMIDEFDLRSEVRLLGPRGDIPQVMNAIDLHVLSSLGEAFPNVLAEAMACGTPCVTTDVGDAASIVGETGWVVPPSKPQRLMIAVAEAVDELHSRRSWETRCSAARNRILERYDIEAMVKAYASLWANSLS